MDEAGRRGTGWERATMPEYLFKGKAKKRSDEKREDKPDKKGITG
jgi:hypothetical protein